MLDIKILRNDLAAVERAMLTRGKSLEELQGFAQLDANRRSLLQESEQLKNQRNIVSQEVAKKKKAGESADELILQMREVGNRIAELDEEIKEIEGELNDILLAIPNLPLESVPVGGSEEDNVELRRWGQFPQFDFAPLPHWEIASELDIVDFERASKVTGARYAFYKGAGARIERALIQFMMDIHADRHGYTEMLPPYLVNRNSLIGTGQLPKFEEDLFKIAGTEDYLIPTAEVPVTNYHSGEILSLDQLPVRYCAYSACFRSEAGSAGRDTRGLIRLHQFNKVELVKFTAPEHSEQALETLTQHAETILQLLKLPYRVIALCTGDMGFHSAKTYDLEVWLPHSNMYREISSCSSFGDFQARRANIRFRREPNAKPEFVHTLNGSGLAVGRTVAAILENNQQSDGSVTVPEVLQPYMGGLQRIYRK